MILVLAFFVEVLICYKHRENFMNLADNPMIPSWKIVAWLCLLTVLFSRIIFLSLRDHLFIRIKPKTYVPEESKSLK